MQMVKLIKLLFFIPNIFFFVYTVLKVVNNRTPDFGVRTAFRTVQCGLFEVCGWPHAHS